MCDTHWRHSGYVGIAFAFALSRHTLIATFQGSTDMSNPLDAASIISQAEAMLAIARLSLQSCKSSLQVQTSEEELSRFVAEQVGLAQQQIEEDAPAIEVDPATRFARQVHRRRAIV
jgi:hypothetical protein